MPLTLPLAEQTHALFCRPLDASPESVAVFATSLRYDPRKSLIRLRKEMLRSLKTLLVRVRQQASNAELLAHALDENRQKLGIKDVLFPGLKGHAGHEIATRQMANFGSLVSIRIEGGPKRVEQVLTQCNLFHFAVSLGGVESLIQHPASLTHAAVPEEHREETGVGSDLVRLALGIEDFDDLKDDSGRSCGAVFDSLIALIGWSSLELSQL